MKIMTHIEFLKWQVTEYNRLKKADKVGYNCTACLNRRYFARIDDAGNFALRECTCNNIIKAQRVTAEEIPRRRR